MSGIISSTHKVVLITTDNGTTHVETYGNLLEMVLAVVNTGYFQHPAAKGSGWASEGHLRAVRAALIGLDTVRTNILREQEHASR